MFHNFVVSVYHWTIIYTYTSLNNFAFLQNSKFNLKSMKKWFTEIGKIQHTYHTIYEITGITV